MGIDKGDGLVKSQFYLLDDNEIEWEGKPYVRFWGVDEKGARICLLSNLIMPYCYFLPNQQDNLETIRQKVFEDKRHFPKIIGISIETKKRLGQECKVLKIICAESDVRSNYLKELQRLAGKGEGFENDVRLPVRYMTDLMLTPCGWNECEADKMKFDGAAGYDAYITSTAPKSVADDTVPTLRILAFYTLTVGEKGSAKPESDPIRAIAIATNSGRSTTLVSEKDDVKVLKDFVAFVKGYDPDIIVGFQTNTQDWLYLIQRSRAVKFKLAVGRDSSEPHNSVYGHVSVAGRANLDLFDVASGIPEVKVKTLENLAKYLRLDSAGKFTTFEEWDRSSLWAEESGRRKLVENASMSAHASLELAKETMDFPMQLSALTGLPLD
ncbi:MAG: 3'-5' exonuclease [Candidatus Bathyarchaeia archaeon]